MEIEKNNFPILPAGEITRMAVTEANHVYVEGILVIRGVEWRWNCHFHRWTDGKWNIGLESDTSYNRSYSLHAYHPTTHDNFTPAARSKAISIILPVFTEWTYANAPAFEEAQADHLAKAIAKREGDIEQHQNAIDVLKMEIEKLKSGVDLGMYSKVYHYTFSIEK